MKAILSRRRFLQVSGLTIASALLPAIGNDAPTSSAPPAEYRIRVRPLSPETATDAEKAYCARARFKTAADAMRATAARGLEAEIYEE